ncbi:MAG: hypothetical protein CMC82_02625 [Flavobacteriaceae bacterium]|nr:hypothetical protein [Flavobacteriaceae bacterium]
MNNPQQATSEISPRLIYITLLLALFALAIGDHLISPALSNLGAPVEPGNTCAPCGAPCFEVKPVAD